MMDRENRVDIDELSEKDFIRLQNTLTKKVKNKIEKTVTDLNKLLNLYGLEIFLAVKIVKKDNSNLSKEEVFSDLRE